MAYIMQARYAVKSDSGNYFGNITTSETTARETLNRAQTTKPSETWSIICWYDQHLSPSEMAGYFYDQ